MSATLTELVMQVGARIGLKLSDMLVLTVVCWKAYDDSDRCFLSNADIGGVIGSHRNTVQRIISRLRAKDLVASDEHRGLIVRRETLEAYLPAPVGSGRMYAGFDENGEKLTTDNCHSTTLGCQQGDNPQLSGDNPQLSRRQLPVVTIYKTKDTTHTQGAREVSDVNDWAGFEAFRAAYPRPARSLSEMKDGWLVARGCGWGTQALLRALEAAKRSNQWQEEGGRYIPRPEVWLGESRYMDFAQDVTEADRARKDREWEAERIRRLIAQQEADEKALRSAQEAQEGPDR